MLNFCSSCSFLSPNSKVNDWFCNEIPGAFFFCKFLQKEVSVSYEKAMHYGHLLDAKDSSFKKDKGEKIEAYQQGNMNM